MQKAFLERLFRSVVPIVAFFVFCFSAVADDVYDRAQNRTLRDLQAKDGSITGLRVEADPGSHCFYLLLARGSAEAALPETDLLTFGRDFRVRVHPDYRDNGIYRLLLLAALKDPGNSEVMAQSFLVDSNLNALIAGVFEISTESAKQLSKAMDQSLPLALSYKKRFLALMKTAHTLSTGELKTLKKSLVGAVEERTPDGRLRLELGYRLCELRIGLQKGFRIEVFYSQEAPSEAVVAIEDSTEARLTRF